MHKRSEIKFTSMFPVLFLAVLLLFSSASFAANAYDLAASIGRNDIEDVRRLLEGGVDLNEISSFYSGLPSLEMVELLLNNEEHPLSSDKFLSSVMQTSCTSYNTEKGFAELDDGLVEQQKNLVELAVEKGADLNKIEWFSDLPSFSFSEFLLDNEKNPMDLSAFLNMVMQKKSKNEEEELKKAGLVELALEKGADLNKIEWFSDFPSFSLSEFLLNSEENPLSPDKFLNLVIKMSCKTHNHEKGFAELDDELVEQQKNLVELALEKGADPNKIEWFSDFPSFSLSEFLLNNEESPLSPDKFLRLIMDKSCKTHNTEKGFVELDDELVEQQKNLVEFALEKGADPNNIGWFSGLPSFSLSELLLNNEKKSMSPSRFIDLVLRVNIQKYDLEINKSVDDDELIAKRDGLIEMIVEDRDYPEILKCILGKESSSEPYLPRDKTKVKWDNLDQHGNVVSYDRNYAEGSYFGADGNKYSARLYFRDSLRTTREFFANKIYQLFGFSLLPQHVVCASDILSFKRYDQYSPVAMVTQHDSDLRTFSDLSEEELEGMQEQLAKLHIISALVGKETGFGEGDLFVQGQEIYIEHASNSFSHIHHMSHITQEGEKYGPTADDLKRFINPQHNWELAKLFQKPFQNYTLEHIQEIIDWLDSSWDEGIIDSLYKEVGVDYELLINLKSRFQDIKRQLEEIKSEGYEVYDSEKISKIIKEKKIKRSQGGAIVKNINYKFRKDLLPKIEEQMFICSDGSRAWFEFTNFEFLVNGRESNNLVKIYIGDDLGDVYKLKSTEKQAIEIFDPEAAFVFQDAVVRFWDKHAQDSSENTKVKLTKALQAGYSAISYHFGFSSSLQDGIENSAVIASDPREDGGKRGNPGKNILKINSDLYQKYKEEMKSTDRLVAREDIEEQKEIGLIAYYPNPVYLHNVALYLRPPGMSYNDYAVKGEKRLSLSEGLPMECGEEYLSRSSDYNFDKCDEYTQVLKRAYPDMTYLDPVGNYSYSDFKRKSVYAFRGDGREAKEVYDANGFWVREYTPEGKMIANERKKELLASDSFWQMFSSGIMRGGRSIEMLYPGGVAYVSTSNHISIAREYGKNIYAVFADGGLSLPADVSGRKVYDTDHMEIAIPGGTKWENVVGVRTRKAGHYHGVFDAGPVFLKSNLVKDDPENFWKILQIMGGKKQCSTPKVLSDVVKFCANTLEYGSEKNIKEFLDLAMPYDYAYRFQGLTQQDIRGIIDSMSKSERIEKAGNFCQAMLEDALGLDFPDRRVSLPR